MADTVRELLIKVTVDAKTDGLDQLNDAQERSQVKAVALGGVLANMAKRLGDVAIAAAKAGAALLQDIVFGSAEAADEVAKASKQLAVNAQQLQRLRGAAQLSGASTASLDKGIRTLTKGLSDAAETGTGPAAEALAVLGLEVADIDSLLAEGSIEEALGLIGESFNATGESAQRNAALMDLFGAKGGSELRPLLEEGAAGVAALGDQISATGSVIEDDALAQFEAMQDAGFLVEQQLAGLEQTVALALAPAMTDLADLTREWIAENDDFIQQDLPVLLAETGSALIELAGDVVDLLKSWREFIRDVERLREDYAAFIDDNEELATAIGTVISPVEALADAFLPVLENLAEAIGLGEEFKAVIESITPGESAGRSVARGQGAAGRVLGPQFAGGGPALLGEAPFKAAEATGDTTKLARIADDPRFSDNDRASAREAAALIDQRKALEAQDRLAKENAQRRAEVAGSRAALSSARRERPARRRGGGGRRAGPSEPTVEELVGLTVEGASAGALRSASSALSGTLLITNDNSVNINTTLAVGGVTVSAALPTDVGPEAAAAISGAVRSQLDEQAREAAALIAQRRNIGP
jgi:hypothetical protein